MTVEDPAGPALRSRSATRRSSHEAVPGPARGTVVEVFRKGYSLKDRLLRPALVKVAKGDDGDESEAAGARYTDAARDPSSRCRSEQNEVDRG